MTILKKGSLFGMLAACLAVVPCYASTTFNWNGGSSGAWDSASSWLNGGVVNGYPGQSSSGDIAIFDSATQVQVQVSTTAVAHALGELRVKSGTVVQLTPSSGTPTIPTSLLKVIDSTSSLRIDASLIIESASTEVNASTSMYIYGTLAASGSVTDDGDMTVYSSTGVMEFSSGADMAGTGAFNLYGTFEVVSGQCDIDSGLAITDAAGAEWRVDYIGAGSDAVLAFNDAYVLAGDIRAVDNANNFILLASGDVSTTGSFFSGFAIKCNALKAGSAGDLYWTGTAGVSTGSSPCLH